MKRLAIILFLLFICCNSSNSFSNDRYISKNPPPDSLIVKVYSWVYDERFDKNREITELVGKSKISENTWEVLYFYKEWGKRGSYFSDDMVLIKLDTNIWIMRVPKHLQIIPKL